MKDIFVIKEDNYHKYSSNQNSEILVSPPPLYHTTFPLKKSNHIFSPQNPNLPISNKHTKNSLASIRHSQHS